MYHAVKFHGAKSPVSYFLPPQLLAAGLIVSLSPSLESYMGVTASGNLVVTFGSVELRFSALLM